MYFFICLSLAIAFLTDSQPAWAMFLLAPLSLNLGLGGVIVALVLSRLTKIVPPQLWYDLFAGSTLLIWYNQWYSVFREGSPVLYFFPLFFALMTALFSLMFIKQKDQLDQESVKYLQWFSDFAAFNPAVIAAFVLLSLLMKQHYLLYPVSIVLLVMRYTLTATLK